MHRPSEPLAQTPQTEMFGGGWALRLRLWSPREWAEVGGMETA